MSTLRVGVDVAKATLAVAVWWDGRGTVLPTVPNTPDGFAQLAAQIRTQQAATNATAVQLIMEPTGGYELALAAFAAQQRWAVSLPNPRHVRDWAKSQGRRAKTDRQDALLLAHYGADHQLPTWAPLPAEISELESLLRRREDLEQLLRQERNRQQQLTARPDVSAAVPASVKRVVAALEEELAAVEQALRDLAQAHPSIAADVRRLRQVPGIGSTNVWWVLLVLHRWGSLTHGQGDAKGLAAYCGLDPQPYESGSSVRKRAQISRQGLPQIRAQLYMGVLGGLRRKGDNPLRAFYEGLVARGKAKKVALLAGARKIMVWAWAVFQHQSTFDPTKATRRPAQAA